eukprot:TRINITY_DN10986_c0_g1_i2.p1 TRINITY_DN10986_c0_g1~~TRINITY_DN10986_c0_g1_i2.p1  ORF type:complete len:294 (+),score=63.45 TRINITY_DN10986_c0_g1_i2:84-965(+)
MFLPPLACLIVRPQGNRTRNFRWGPDMVIALWNMTAFIMLYATCVLFGPRAVEENAWWKRLAAGSGGGAAMLLTYAQTWFVIPTVGLPAAGVYCFFAVAYVTGMKGMGLELSRFLIGGQLMNTVVGCVVVAGFIVAELKLGFVQHYMDACYELSVTTRVAPGARARRPLRAPAVHGPRTLYAVAPLTNNDLEQLHDVILCVSPCPTQWAEFALGLTAEKRDCLRAVDTSDEFGRRWAELLQLSAGTYSVIALRPLQRETCILYVGSSVPAPAELPSECGSFQVFLPRSWPRTE